MDRNRTKIRPGEPKFAYLNAEPIYLSERIFRPIFELDFELDFFIEHDMDRNRTKIRPGEPKFAYLNAEPI